MAETLHEDLGPFRDSLVRLLAPWRQDGRPRGGEEQVNLWQELCRAGWGALGHEPGDVPLLALAMEECGAAGLPVPLIGAVAGHRLLADRQEILEAIADGSIRLALALGRFDGDTIAGCASFAEGRANGSLAGVEDCGSATHLLTASAEGEVGLIALDQPGVSLTPAPGYADPPLTRITLRDVSVTVFAGSADAIGQLADLARLLLIARGFGAARRGFAIAVEYAGIRRQFGQLIGSFQAIRHKLADVRVRLDLTEVLLEQAADSFVRSGDTARALASLVSVASPALRQAALEVQHVFAGIGYAAEHEAARHFTRIHADTTRMGGLRRARHLLAGRLRGAADRDAVFPIGDEPEPIQRLRTQVRAWLAEHWGAKALRDPARNREVDRGFIRALAEKGWLTASWPKEHGGPGFDAFQQFAFLEEMRGAEAPMVLISPSYWVVAPSIIAEGWEAMKAALLPQMAQGRISFALGYSEPQAGSDLAALSTRAVRDGDDYLINGQKIWTSNTEHASHIFLAARTGGDPVSDKHSGITLFVVPIDAPGISIQRMATLHGKTFAVVFLDDVRVPSAMRVAGEGDGWKVLGAALGAERIIMGGQIASLRGLVASLVADLQARPEYADDPVTWSRLAECVAELEGARALSRRSVRLIHEGKSAMIEGAIAKLFTGDLAERIGEAILDLCGVEAGLDRFAPDALLDGSTSHYLRTAIMIHVAGGSAEVQRNTIARQILPMAR